MCECISNSQKALTELFYKEIDTTDGNISAEYDNTTLMLGSGTVQFCGYVEASYKVGKQTKKWKKNILFTFCPLCGIKYVQ